MTASTPSDLMALLGDSEITRGPSRPSQPPTPAKDDSGLSGPIPAILAESELAALLGLSGGAIRYQAGKGTLRRVAPGQYDTRASIAAYCESQRENVKRAGNPKSDAKLQAAKLRSQTAMADKLELANSKARGDMVASSTVERAWSGVLRDVRSAMLALPSRIGATLPHLTAHDVAAIDREIKAALEGLADGTD